jgi:branched-chain amino acid transport system ATP-binding protein
MTHNETRGCLSPLLETTNLDAGYGSVPVLHDISITVRAGEIVSLLGANGAGKTTFLRAVAGVIPTQSGTIVIQGEPAQGALQTRAKRGLGVVPEERSIFRGLTVKENCRVAGIRLPQLLEIFPDLEPRMGLKAGLLSGGEQQMLALGLALARKPSLLLVDELSLGLAPLIVDTLLDVLRKAADSGLGVLLVEQHIRRSLDVADTAYVLQRGRIQLSGRGEDLRARVADVEASYFAPAGAEA